MQFALELSRLHRNQSVLLQFACKTRTQSVRHVVYLTHRGWPDALPSPLDGLADVVGLTGTIVLPIYVGTDQARHEHDWMALGRRDIRGRVAHL